MGQIQSTKDTSRQAVHACIALVLTGTRVVHLTYQYMYSCDAAKRVNAIRQIFTNEFRDVSTSTWRVATICVIFVSHSFSLGTNYSNYGPLHVVALVPNGPEKLTLARQLVHG